jgi:hypothetical protein
VSFSVPRNLSGRRSTRLRSEAPGTRTGGRRPLRFGRRRAPNQQKRNESFANRNETFRVADPKSLKSLMVLNQRFRGIVCFQSLNHVFVSRSRRVHLFDPKSLRPAGAARLFEKLRAAVGGRDLARLVWLRGCDGWTSGLGFDDARIIAEASWKCRCFSQVSNFQAQTQPNPPRFFSFGGIPAPPIPESVQNKLRCTAT